MKIGLSRNEDVVSRLPPGMAGPLSILPRRTALGRAARLQRRQSSNHFTLAVPRQGPTASSSSPFGLPLVGGLGQLVHDG